MLSCLHTSEVSVTSVWSKFTGIQMFATIQRICLENLVSVGQRGDFK